jgi:hypothetical protein
MKKSKMPGKPSTSTNDYKWTCSIAMLVWDILSTGGYTAAIFDRFLLVKPPGTNQRMAPGQIGTSLLQVVQDGLVGPQFLSVSSWHWKLDADSTWFCMVLHDFWWFCTHKNCLIKQNLASQKVSQCYGIMTSMIWKYSWGQGPFWSFWMMLPR